MKASEAAVVVLSDVADLTPLYEDARVFIAPTRFGARISLKVIEAAARGVPAVATTLVARQLGWESGLELITADAPAQFAEAVIKLCVDRNLWMRVRTAALAARIEREHSRPAFRSSIADALRVVASARPCIRPVRADAPASIAVRLLVRRMKEIAEVDTLSAEPWGPRPCARIRCRSRTGPKPRHADVHSASRKVSGTPMSRRQTARRFAPRTRDGRRR